MEGDKQHDQKPTADVDQGTKRARAEEKIVVKEKVAGGNSSRQESKRPKLDFEATRQQSSPVAAADRYLPHHYFPKGKDTMAKYVTVADKLKASYSDIRSRLKGLDHTLDDFITSRVGRGGELDIPSAVSMRDLVVCFVGTPGSGKRQHLNVALLSKYSMDEINVDHARYYGCIPVPNKNVATDDTLFPIAASTGGNNEWGIYTLTVVDGKPVRGTANLLDPLWKHYAPAGEDMHPVLRCAHILEAIQSECRAESPKELHVALKNKLSLACGELSDLLLGVDDGKAVHGMWITGLFDIGHYVTFIDLPSSTAELGGVKLMGDRSQPGVQLLSKAGVIAHNGVPDIRWIAAPELDVFSLNGPPPVLLFIATDGAFNPSDEYKLHVRHTVSWVGNALTESLEKVASRRHMRYSTDVARYIERLHDYTIVACFPYTIGTYTGGSKSLFSSIRPILYEGELDVFCRELRLMKAMSAMNANTTLRQPFIANIRFSKVEDMTRIVEQQISKLHVDAEEFVSKDDSLYGMVVLPNCRELLATLQEKAAEILYKASSTGASPSNRVAHYHCSIAAIIYSIVNKRFGEHGLNGSHLDLTTGVLASLKHSPQDRTAFERVAYRFVQEIQTIYDSVCEEVSSKVADYDKLSGMPGISDLMNGWATKVEALLEALPGPHYSRHSKYRGEHIPPKRIDIKRVAAIETESLGVKGEGELARTKVISVEDSVNYSLDDPVHSIIIKDFSSGVNGASTTLNAVIPSGLEKAPPVNTGESGEIGPELRAWREDVWSRVEAHLFNNDLKAIEGTYFFILPEVEAGHFAERVAHIPGVRFRLSIVVTLPPTPPTQRHRPCVALDVANALSHHFGFLWSFKLPESIINEGKLAYEKPSLPHRTSLAGVLHSAQAFVESANAYALMEHIYGLLFDYAGDIHLQIQDAIIHVGAKSDDDVASLINHVDTLKFALSERKEAILTKQRSRPPLDTSDIVKLISILEKYDPNSMVAKKFKGLLSEFGLVTFIDSRHLISTHMRNTRKFGFQFELFNTLAKKADESERRKASKVHASSVFLPLLTNMYAEENFSFTAANGDRRLYLEPTDAVFDGTNAWREDVNAFVGKVADTSSKVVRLSYIGWNKSD